MMNLQGAEISPEIVVPHVREVTAEDCDPDRVTDGVGHVAGTDDVLALMYAKG